MAYNLVESKTISVETSGENIRLKATGDFGNENVVVGSIRTKNIFGNYTIVNGYLFETRMSIRTSASDRLAFIECKPNTTYTISRSVITTSFRVSDYTSIPPMTDTYVDYTVPTVVENNSGSTITYTTSPTAKYLVIHYGNALNDTATNLANTLKTMQVEEGTTASTFSPYQNLTGKNYSFYNENGWTVKLYDDKTFEAYYPFSTSNTTTATDSLFGVYSSPVLNLPNLNIFQNATIYHYNLQASFTGAFSYSLFWMSGTGQISYKIIAAGQLTTAQAYRLSAVVYGKANN